MDINKEYEEYLKWEEKHSLLDTLFDVCFEQRDKLKAIREWKERYCLQLSDRAYNALMEVLDG